MNDVAYQNAMSDDRPRCILCERLLLTPTPTPAKRSDAADPVRICRTCTALPPAERRALCDRAMTRLLRA